MLCQHAELYCPWIPEYSCGNLILYFILSHLSFTSISKAIYFLSWVCNAPFVEYFSGIRASNLGESCAGSGQKEHKETANRSEEESGKLLEAIQKWRYFAYALYCKWVYHLAWYVKSCLNWPAVVNIDARTSLPARRGPAEILPCNRLAYKASPSDVAGPYLFTY